jgi:hypothetical protein
MTADAATPAPQARSARLLTTVDGMSASDTSGRGRPNIEWAFVLQLTVMAAFATAPGVAAIVFGMAALETVKGSRGFPSRR